MITGFSRGGREQERQGWAKSSPGLEQTGQHRNSRTAAEGGHTAQYGASQVTAAITGTENLLDFACRQQLVDDADNKADHQEQQGQFSGQEQEHMKCLSQHSHQVITHIITMFLKVSKYVGKKIGRQAAVPELRI